VEGNQMGRIQPTKSNKVILPAGEEVTNNIEDKIKEITNDPPEKIIIKQ
jgi:hypothetical protein